MDLLIEGMSMLYRLLATSYCKGSFYGSISNLLAVSGWNEDITSLKKEGNERNNRILTAVTLIDVFWHFGSSQLSKKKALTSLILTFLFNLFQNLSTVTLTSVNCHFWLDFDISCLSFWHLSTIASISSDRYLFRELSKF